MEGTVETVRRQSVSLLVEAFSYCLEELGCPCWKDEGSDGAGDDASDDSLCDVLQNCRSEGRSEYDSK